MKYSVTIEATSLEEAKQKAAQMGSSVVAPRGKQRVKLGSEIRILASTLGLTQFKIHQKASWTSYSNQMHRNGIDWCEQNIPTIVGWLKEEAKSQNVTISGDEALTTLVKTAVDNVKKNLATAKTNFSVRTKPSGGSERAFSSNSPILNQGAGTELKNLLLKFGLKPTVGCKCRQHTIEMNKNGIDWCEQNIPTIVGWLKEEAQRSGYPFTQLGAKILIKRAISNARKKTTS